MDESQQRAPLPLEQGMLISPDTGLGLPYDVERGPAVHLQNLPGNGEGAAWVGTFSSQRRKFCLWQVLFVVELAPLGVLMIVSSFRSEGTLT